MAVWISGQRAESAALQEAESTRRLAISDLLAPISPGTTGAAGTAVPAVHNPAAMPLHSRSLAIAAPAVDLGGVLPSLPFGSAAPQPPPVLAAAPYSHAVATAAAPSQLLGRGSRGVPHTQLATRSRPLGSELRPLATRSTALHIGGHVSRAHTSKGRASAANVIHTNVNDAVTSAFHTVHTSKDGDADESVGEPMTCLARLRGVGVYYTDSADGMPPVLWQFLKNVEAVHEVRSKGACRAHVWAG